MKIPGLISLLKLFLRTDSHSGSNSICGVNPDSVTEPNFKVDSNFGADSDSGAELQNRL